MNTLIRFFINTNIWVAFCVVGLALSSELLLEATNFQILKFVFFGTIFTYNFQRIIRIRKGHEHAHKDWQNKNKKPISFLMFISVLVSGYYFLSFKLITQSVILIAAIISVLYPLFLRKLPFAKIFIIAFVWAISTFLLLVLENNILISQNVIWHFASRFLFVFAITIPFDIRDLHHDSKNIITIPLFFGVQRAKIIAIFALFICGIISFFQFLERSLNLPNLLALIALYVLTSIFIQKSDIKKAKKYFSFWVESLSLGSYFLLVISELIF